jgi:hypothetical protein
VAAQFCHRQGRSIVYFSSSAAAVSSMEFMMPAHDVFLSPRPRPPRRPFFKPVVWADFPANPLPKSTVEVGA